MVSRLVHCLLLQIPQQALNSKIKLQLWPSDFKGPTGNTVTPPEDPSDDPCLITSETFKFNFVNASKITKGQ